LAWRWPYEVLVKLWLLRHAKVDLDEGLCYGASDLTAIAHLSLKAARAAAKELPLKLPLRVSGLKRAQQLALELCRLRSDLQPPVVDQRLNEMDFGSWELQPWDKIPQTAFDDWMADFAYHRFGGVESTQQVIQRVADAIEELRNQAVQEAVWVTHAGVIRAVAYLSVAGSRKITSVGEWPKHAPDPGGFVVIEC